MVFIITDNPSESQVLPNMDPMAKMWVSFIGIGLMVFAALLVSFARAKTKGVLRGLLTTIAFLMLLVGILYGVFAIL